VHTMPQRAEHRIGERALIPGAVVTAPVDEKVGVKRTPLANALSMSRSTRRLARAAIASAVSASSRVNQSVGHGAQIVLGQRVRTRHQRDVRIPELRVIRGRLRKFGRGRAMSLPISGRCRNT